MLEENEEMIDIEMEAITGFHLALALSLELKERFGAGFAEALIRRMKTQREEVLDDQMLGDAALLDAGITELVRIFEPSAS